MIRKGTRNRAEAGTRERVLAVALELFNQDGMHRVTTRRIAETAGINEGNLYYYFRTKESLALAMLDRVEKDAVALFLLPGIGSTDELEVYDALLKSWFMMTWNYRFMFRDLLTSNTPPNLDSRVRAIAVRLQDAARVVFIGMEQEGLIAGDRDDLEAMLANAFIVSGYWMSFLQLREGADGVTLERIDWGVAQVRSLYKPYLTAKALDQMQNAAP